MRARAFTSLLTWLGPFMPSGRVPRATRRETVRVPGAGDVEESWAWLYAPAHRAPSGALVVVPGLHFAGPGDARLNRFLRVLARAGVVAFCPFLPDFSRLVVTERVTAQLERAVATLLAHPARPRHIRPGMFSISFGSLPALKLAASDAYRNRVGAVVVFGGYADFDETLRYALGDRTGFEDAPPSDPLNLPVVFLNLLEDLEGPRDKTRVAAAWRGVVRATWGKMELKAPALYRPVAARFEAGLGDDERALYRLGCGLAGDPIAAARRALARRPDARAHLDPRPHLDGLRAPVHVMHGADDDVIPHRQADALLAALPPHIERTRDVTGLFHHTGGQGLDAILRGAPAAAREARTLVGMLTRMVDAARHPV